MSDTEFPAASETLAALRAELDTIDDALHALLRRRAEVVGRIGRAKEGVALRPGREAAILRRLLATHDGALPPVAIVRIWRELFAATTALQGQFVISVADDPAHAITALAREQFGAATPLSIRHTPAEALADLAEGGAAAAVLPAAAEEGPGAWWAGLLGGDGNPAHIVGLLPFWAPRTEGAPRVPAMVLSPVPPDPSGADRTIIGLKLPGAASRSQLAAQLAEAGLTPVSLLLQPHAALATLDGFIEAGDARLSALPGLSGPPVRLGAYPVPVGEPA